MQDLSIDIPEGQDIMVLDLLNMAKEQDPSISFRRSCGEGVCGSDGMNINGKNGLGCITPLSEALKGNKIVLSLINDEEKPEREIKQTVEEREKLDGLYECIMCGCCSTACPSFWWNPDKFLGPAALLQAHRFISDSRDTATEERLDQLEDAFSVFKCHGIMNCVSVCPKGLNPTKEINEIKKKLVKRAL